MSTEDNEYDLQEAWEQACRSFATTAHVDINLLQGRALTPDDVVAQLKLKRHADEEKKAQYKVLKDVLGRTLVLIQNLGEIASSAASMVYGPSTLCFNAVSYLIAAGQNYRNIFASLTQLFKDVSDILERFAVYIKMKQVDRPLRKIIHEILLSFVSICELSVHVIHGNKLGKFLKVFAFNEDDGVGGAIASLRTLVEREAQMKATLTYQIVKEGFGDAQVAISGVKASVDKMMDDARKKESDSLERKQVEKIKAKLGVQEEVDEQVKLHRRLLSETVPGSGRWIYENRQFIEWSDRSSPWDKVFLLSANEGYGKSFLVTTIVHGLEKRYTRSTSDPSRPTTAYYYVEQQSSGRTPIRDQGVQPIVRALKTLALQLAQEPVYRKDLAALCENWIEPDSPEELFSRLFGPCLRSHETFYVILDGIDQMGEQSVKTLLDLLKVMQAQHTPDQQSHLRILLSGRPPLLKPLTNPVQLRAVNIDIAVSNGPDLVCFIADRLYRIDVLQGKSEQVQNLRKEVFLSLSEGAQGDFINVELLLKEIGSKRWPAEIRDVLANKSQRSDTIAREVRRCNQTFQARDIHDLNVLLTWVMSAKRTLTVEELEAVLFLKNKEASLRPLYDQLRDQYSAFFFVEKPDDLEPNKASVTLVSNSIKEYFRSLVQTKQEEEGTQRGKIHPSEIKIMRRFLERLCDEDLYAKFGFEEFFQRKLSSNTALVHVDLDNSHLQVFLDCLHTIPRYEEVAVRPLHHYARRFFVAHLQEIDLTTTSPSDKAQVGQYLVDMFSDQNIIAKWWNSHQIYSSAAEWFYEDGNVDVVLGWLRDPATIGKCSQAGRDWVKTLASNSFPDADLLEHVSTYLADCLFCSPSVFRGNPVNLVRMLHAFLRKLRRRRSPSKSTLQVNMATKPITVKQINEISKWASERLRIDKPGFEWTRSVARAYRQFDHYQEAIQAYEAAGKLREDHWFSDYGLASTYFDFEEWPKAAEVYEDILRRVEAGEAKEPSPAEHITRIRLCLAWAYVQTGEYDKAMAMYNQHLVTNPDDYTAVLERMIALRRQQKFANIIETLQQLQKEQDPTHSISRLSVILHNIDDLDLHNGIVLAGMKTGSLRFVQTAYRSAIEEALDPGYLPRNTHAKAQYRVMLTCKLADLLYNYPQSHEDREEAMDLWEASLADADDIGFTPSRFAAAKSLSTVYFEQLRQGSQDSQSTAETIKKLLQLSGEMTSETDAFESTLDTRLLVGRYYSKAGMKTEARDCLRGHIKVGIDLLSDEDPNNDWQGYLRLASALMYYGDKDAALAAWSLIGPNDFSQQDDVDGFEEVNDATTTKIPGVGKEDASITFDNDTADTLASDGPQKPDQTAPPARAKTFRKLEGPLDYYCDGGGCEHGWTYADGIYVCMDCLDVMFAAPCYELLRKDALEIKACSPTHDFLHVPLWDEHEAEERGPHQVRQAGKPVPVSEWIKEIRQKWQLEDG
ncbi:hypothetical protein A1O3_06223 [Capronia epimyces CBS 606.96]|uniref:Uncharacterized protein n=1 Tax=Capronia epimyces CBS 606.96 TaxID=1182542 RepID=W9XYI2_9EURO|nr:uncharacterized protein A1O3_06223 [Capronia epimyces CBS 606.96]EXJ82410.1 hypothetical protein A1O3_06223 [Capronia epimyces CBS 606.96]